MEQRVLYSKVRVLHAACFAPQVCVMIGNREVVSGLGYGETSGYTRITGGFRRVSILCSQNGEELLAQTIPFPEGSQITLVLCSTVSQLALIPMSEVSCNPGKGKGCIRVANFTFDDGPFQVRRDDEVIFSCIAPRSCTPFLPAAAGSYDFWLARLEDCIAGTGNGGDKEEAPESAGEIYMRVMPEISYTACILGDCGGGAPLEIKVLEF